MYIHFTGLRVKTRKASDVVPPTVRQRVVAVQVREPGIPRAVVQVAKSQPQKPTNAAQRPMLNPVLFIVTFSWSILTPPKGGSPRFQAVRRMPLLPLQESRATQYHQPYDKARKPVKHDKPANPEPWFKKPKASHSLVPVVVPVPFS